MEKQNEKTQPYRDRDDSGNAACACRCSHHSRNSRDTAVPSGYNENDYNKLVDFLEMTDGDGTVDYMASGSSAYYSITAVPDAAEIEFKGFFDENDELISMGWYNYYSGAYSLDVSELDNTVIYARFDGAEEEPTPAPTEAPTEVPFPGDPPGWACGLVFAPRQE